MQLVSAYPALEQPKCYDIIHPYNWDIYLVTQNYCGDLFEVRNKGLLNLPTE